MSLELRIFLGFLAPSDCCSKWVPRGPKARAGLQEGCVEIREPGDPAASWALWTLKVTSLLTWPPTRAWGRALRTPRRHTLAFYWDGEPAGRGDRQQQAVCVPPPPLLLGIEVGMEGMSLREWP